MTTIVALLTVADPDAFDRFEREAIAIMKSYGGQLETAFTPKPTGAKQGVDEVHVLKFPDLAAFEAYRVDDRLEALAALRQQAIGHSSVYVSEREVDYST